VAAADCPLLSLSLLLMMMMMKWSCCVVHRQ
jgi:hypothetical protein